MWAYASVTVLSSLVLFVYCVIKRIADRAPSR